MDGPWVGMLVMAAMVVGLVWWCIWAIRRDKKEKD